MSYTTRRQREEGLRVCGLPGKMYLYIRDVPILPVSMYPAKTRRRHARRYRSPHLRRRQGGGCGLRVAGRARALVLSTALLAAARAFRARRGGCACRHADAGMQLHGGAARCAAGRTPRSSRASASTGSSLARSLAPSMPLPLLPSLSPCLPPSLPAPSLPPCLACHHPPLSPIPHRTRARTAHAPAQRTPTRARTHASLATGCAGSPLSPTPVPGEGSIG